MTFSSTAKKCKLCDRPGKDDKWIRNSKHHHPDEEQPEVTTIQPTTMKPPNPAGKAGVFDTPLESGMQSVHNHHEHSMPSEPDSGTQEHAHQHTHDGGEHAAPGATRC